jgi:hypothetical protein
MIAFAAQKPNAFAQQKTGKCILELISHIPSKAESKVKNAARLRNV